MILPIRKKGNQLLCTLLLGNVVVNSFLSIFMAELTTGWLGLLASTTLIVTFGEIFPQALCTRYGLVVGARTIGITKFFLAVMYVAAWPMSKVLDWILGQEVGTIYSRSELLKLITIHAVEDPHAMKESGLTHEDHKLLTGALEYSSKTVKDVMTSVDKVYMIDASTRLNFENMLDIYRSGFTRIPAFEGSRQNIIGILYVKDLILLDPDDEIEVKTVITFHGRAGVRFILDSTPLSEVFRLFKQSVYHMMIAVNLKLPEGQELSALTSLGGTGSTPSRTALADLLNQNTLLQAERSVSGVITLEDVLEEVIKDEIMDETDVAEAEARGRRGAHANRADISQYMSVFSHKAREQSKLSPQEVDAVAAYLSVAVSEFKPFQRHEAALKGLVRNALVIDLEKHDTDSEFDGSMPDEGSDAGERSEAASGINGPSSRLERTSRAPDGSFANVIYRRGEPSDFFTLILQGHASVKAGAEEFSSELGPWSVLGNRALDVAAIYVPDFTATVTPPCRLIRIRKDQLFAASKAAQMDSALAKRAIKRVSEAITRTAQSKNLGPSPALVDAVTDQSLRDMIAGQSYQGEGISTPRLVNMDEPSTPGAMSTWGAAGMYSNGGAMHPIQQISSQNFHVQAYFDPTGGPGERDRRPSEDAARDRSEGPNGTSPRGPGALSRSDTTQQRHQAQVQASYHAQQQQSQGQQPLYLPYQLPPAGTPGPYLAIPAASLSMNNRMLLTSIGTQEEQEKRLLQVAAQQAQQYYPVQQAQQQQYYAPASNPAFQPFIMHSNPGFSNGGGQLMVPLPMGYVESQEQNAQLLRSLQEKAGGVPPSPAVTYVSWDSTTSSGVGQPGFGGGMGPPSGPALELSPSSALKAQGGSAKPANPRFPHVASSRAQRDDDIAISIASGDAGSGPLESEGSSKEQERKSLLTAGPAGSIELSHM